MKECQHMSCMRKHLKITKTFAINWTFASTKMKKSFWWMKMPQKSSINRVRSTFKTNSLRVSRKKIYWMKLFPFWPKKYTHTHTLKYERNCLEKKSWKTQQNISLINFLINICVLASLHNFSFFFFIFEYNRRRSIKIYYTFTWF
jgi:hypothetical protein